MTPGEAQKIMRYCESIGVTVAELARRLGVSELYAHRLKKSSYWPSGNIPKKTAVVLQKIFEEYSPSAHRNRIIECADRLGKGDLYFIHSLREVLEFGDAEIRAAILRCAKRGVEVHYIFPDLKRIFEGYGKSLLDLAELIPLDLRNKFELLMQTFLTEAKTTRLCKISDLKKHVFFKEHSNGFLFSPWNKLIFTRSNKKNVVTSTVIQEHHPLGAVASRDNSSFNWTCESSQSERIGRILQFAECKVLPWPDDNP